MFDPAAIGTLLIGLNSVDRDARPDRVRPTGAAPRRYPGGVRLAAAALLRRAATSLEGPAIRGIAR